MHAQGRARPDLRSPDGPLLNESTRSLGTRASRPPSHRSPWPPRRRDRNGDAPTVRIGPICAGRAIGFAARDPGPRPGGGARQQSSGGRSLPRERERHLNCTVPAEKRLGVRLSLDHRAEPPAGRASMGDVSLTFGLFGGLARERDGSGGQFAGGPRSHTRSLRGLGDSWRASVSAIGLSVAR